MNKKCIGQRCHHDFVIKDVTVKQVALNVTDMDKINIVSLQTVLKMSSFAPFSMDTRSMSSSPLVNSLVKIDCSIPHQTLMSRRFNSSTLWIYCGRHDAKWQPRSCNPQDWDLGCLEATAWTQESLAFLDAAVQLLRVRGAVWWCTVLLEQSRYQTLCVSLAAVWRHYDVVKQKRRYTTRISCFVTIIDVTNVFMFF